MAVRESSKGANILSGAISRRSLRHLHHEQIIVQEVLRTSYGSGTSNGRHSGIPGPSYIQHPANIRVSANHTVRSVTAIQQSWKHSIAPVDSQDSFKGA